jgi:hypothetical protein
LSGPLSFVGGRSRFFWAALIFWGPLSLFCPALVFRSRSRSRPLSCFVGCSLFRAAAFCFSGRSAEGLWVGSVLHVLGLDRPNLKPKCGLKSKISGRKLNMFGALLALGGYQVFPDTPQTGHTGSRTYPGPGFPVVLGAPGSRLYPCTLSEWLQVPPV